ncbi:hypothetical protein GQ43DRAFT_334541, partial [Delitschia confertaspora ATCC 74209]
VSCLCGAATHTFSVPLSKLPLPTNLCNCNTSRRISGTLVTSYVNITFDPTAPKPDLSALTPYESSDILTRYFCSTCGTHMYLEYKHDDHFEAATGTFKLSTTDDIIDFQSHTWISDTIDGGASQFLPIIAGRQLQRYLQEPDQSEEVPLNHKTHPSTTTEQTKQEGKLHVHCHCNGVQFYISRPTSASTTKTSSPYSDGIIPFHSGSNSNPSNNPWWLAPRGRYLAGTCACSSCRRALGFDIMFWAFIPIANITLDKEGTKSFEHEPYWGTMKVYRSTKDVPRTFCKVCGANVFWHGQVRPTLIDVAAGLMDAESGARAEDWLSWWASRVSFQENALNKGLIEGLAKGLKEWAERNK